MKPLQRQSGLTAISIIIILAVGAFFVAIFFTLFPIYMEHFEVKSHLNALKDDAKTTDITDRDIVKTMMRRFDIDNINHVTEDDIDIEKTDSGRTVSIDYEVRDHFLANIDVVVSFHNEVNLPPRQGQ